jgi:putative phosphoribosyl transferase
VTGTSGRWEEAMLRIVSESSKPFEDRREAGRLLAQEMKDLANKNVVVLGIPRGGVIVAAELAAGLNAELDIVLARKLRTPGHAELAMGAVAEDGSAFLNDKVINWLDIGHATIDQEKSQQLLEIQRRSRLIRSVRPQVPLRGRIAVITDDGVATGSTTQAAIWAMRQAGPARLIAAIPVGAVETIKRLADDVDDMICLRAPEYFEAVGQFYRDFRPIEDEEVLEVLRNAQKTKPAQQPS